MIALTDVDYCEKFPDTSFISNSKIVGNISSAIMAFEFKTRFIHISTDQVYNGDGNHSEETEGNREHPKNEKELDS